MAAEGWFDPSLVAADWFPVDVKIWFDASLVTKASTPVTHATTGALTGPGSAVAGSASRLRAFATSGTLAGPGSAVVGAAARSAGAVTHATSGALTGQLGSVAGAAARLRAMSAVGVLVGPGSALAGSAARFRAFAGSGSLVAPGALLSGAAARSAGAVVHDAVGALVGPGSSLAGAASRDATPVGVLPRGGGIDPKRLKRQVEERDRKLEQERLDKEKLRELIARALDPVKEAEPEQVEVLPVGESVQVTAPSLPAISIPTPPRFDVKEVAAEVSRVLTAIGIRSRQQAAEAENQAMAEEANRRAEENRRIRLKRRREEELLLLM